MESFFEKAVASPELQQKIVQIYKTASLSATESLARLAEESGLPFTAEEFLAVREAESRQLSEEEMEQVSGGATKSIRIGGKSENNGFVDTSWFDPIADFLGDLRRKVRGEDF